MNGSRAGGFLAAGNCSERGVHDRRDLLQKKSGSFIAAEVGCAMQLSRCSRLIFFFRLFFGLETAQQRVCRRLSSAESQHGFSASSSCFWHSRESSTPSSNNFIASSRASCGALEAPDDFFQPGERLLKVRLLGGFQVS